MHDLQTITDEDPLGPVATLPVVTFGARQAAFAGIGGGAADDHGDHLPATMFTWHITCSSIHYGSGDPYGHEQSGS
jgi:hypothetical protein